MTAIWSTDGPTGGWSLLAPAGFPDEAALHTLVENAPQLLPLAGSPRLTVLGREVRLGTGSADLIAVEPSGRLVVIEVKLAHNAEARRAVVAQVLAYAAYLHGLDLATVERDILGQHLAGRQHANLLSAVRSDDQTGEVDADAFEAGLAESLSTGRFRLVIVLDSAPPELVRLVGYLEAMAEQLTIDLVTVASYDVGDRRVLVPQRIEPERRTAEVRPTSSPQTERAQEAERGYLAPGADDFRALLSTMPPEQRELLDRLTEWAVSLERRGLVTLSTFHGRGGMTTLLPRLRADGAGLVTIYWDDRPKAGYLQFWRSVFERRAPRSISAVEAVADVPIGRGNVTYAVSDELLTALTQAYQEAAGGAVSA